MKLWEIFISIDLPDKPPKCLWSLIDILDQATVRKGKLLFIIPPSAHFPERRSLPPNIPCLTTPTEICSMLQCRYPQWGESTPGNTMKSSKMGYGAQSSIKDFSNLRRNHWLQATKVTENKAPTVWFPTWVGKSSPVKTRLTDRMFEDHAGPCKVYIYINFGTHMYILGCLVHLTQMCASSFRLVWSTLSFQCPVSFLNLNDFNQP